MGVKQTKNKNSAEKEDTISNNNSGGTSGVNNSGKKKKCSEKKKDSEKRKSSKKGSSKRKDSKKKTDCLYGTMIPEPDYSDTEQEAMMVGETKRGSRLVQHPYNDDGLIMPKKIHNPCMDSMEKQQLHRELMFNQKMGRNVLNQKTELQKALEKHKEQQVKKELENERQSTLTPFQKILEERAKKERDNSESSSSDEANNKPITENEFLKVHAKVRGRLESK